MRWSKQGAHFVLQTQTRTLDGTLRRKFEPKSTEVGVSFSDQIT